MRSSSPHRRRSSCRSYSCSCTALSSGGGTVFCVDQNCVNFSCHVVDLHVSHGAVLLVVVVVVWYRSHRCHHHHRRRRRPCVACFSLLLLSLSFNLLFIHHQFIVQISVILSTRGLYYSLLQLFILIGRVFFFPLLFAVCILCFLQYPLLFRSAAPF